MKSLETWKLKPMEIASIIVNPDQSFVKKPLEISNKTHDVGTECDFCGADTTEGNSLESIYYRKGTAIGCACLACAQKRNLKEVFIPSAVSSTGNQEDIFNSKEWEIRNPKSAERTSREIAEIKSRNNDSDAVWTRMRELNKKKREELDKEMAEALKKVKINYAVPEQYNGWRVEVACKTKKDLGWD